jgi:hypothetical protein
MSGLSWFLLILVYGEEFLEIAQGFKDEFFDSALAVLEALDGFVVFVYLAGNDIEGPAQSLFVGLPSGFFHVSILA